MANDFEKKIQKNLENLRVEPSQSVWAKIEKRLEKHRKRKTVIWWFSFPVMILLVTGIYYYGQHHPAKDFNQPAAVIPKGQSVRSEISRTPKSTGTENPGSEKSDLVKDKKKISSRHKFTLNANPLLPGVTSNPENPLVFSSGRQADTETSIFAEEQKNFSVLATQISVQEFTNPDFPASSVISSRVTAPEIILTEPALPDKTGKSGWKFGLVFIPGGGYLSHHERIYNSPSYSVSVPYFDPNLNSGIPQQNISLAPSLSGSFSFKAGIKTQKTFHNRTGLSVGLQYEQSTIRQKVTYISVNAMGVTEKYFDSHFRFIELPVGFNLNSKIGRIDMKWEIGANLSHLLNAGALKRLNDQYYKDNSVFRSTQFGVYGGISASVIKSSFISVEAGPYYQYNLSGLSKTGVFGNRHLNFAGIKAEILLQPKK